MPPNDVKQEESDEYSYVEDEEEEEETKTEPRAGAAPPRVVGTAAKSRVVPRDVHVPNSPRSPTSSDRAPRARAGATGMPDERIPAPKAPPPPRAEAEVAPPSRSRRTRKEEGVPARGRTASPPIAAAASTEKAHPAREIPLRGVRGGIKSSPRMPRETIECPICWGEVAKGPAGLSQHQFWSELCNTWRLHTQNGLAWPQAEKAARRLKRDREIRGQNEDVTPAPNLRARQKMEGQTAVTLDDVMALLRDRKTHKHKRRRRRHESPTPEVERKRSRRRDRDPPGDDPEDSRPASVRKGPGGSLILQIPAHMVH